MTISLESVLSPLFQAPAVSDGLQLCDPASQFDPQANTGPSLARSLNAAFLIGLAGSSHADFEAATAWLDQRSATEPCQALARFYRMMLAEVRDEFATELEANSQLRERTECLSSALSSPQPSDASQTQELLWSVFYPEAEGINQDREPRIEALRQKRRISIEQLNPTPLTDPAKQLLFTSNVLLTIPSESTSIESLGLDESLVEQVRRACEEPQEFWYDHPIQLGVAPEANEVLYGLRGLSNMLEFERQLGSAPAEARLTCVLSVSVTHGSLHDVAKPYLLQEVRRAGGFQGLDVVVFTDTDASRLVDEVLRPAATHFLGDSTDVTGLDCLGVDGNYGRHYSFLKAIAAIWQVLIDDGVKATFKIDLDQVFPELELVEQSEASALDHFVTPLWGANGIDADGQAVELGMIAGALVNEKDISRSLFTPDVPFPDRTPRFDECVFFSQLPQALSTRAEMMTRYDDPQLDGTSSCIHRIHVTGGTNGILLDALRKHRPFTPSFIGRAEDQAYLLSVLNSGAGAQLRYAHEPGLIMRHDKEAFAQEAMAAAKVGKMIGDYERILYFSAYGRLIGEGSPDPVKQTIDPFTGGFVSRIPKTLACLRFALKCESLFDAGELDDALDFAEQGSRRILAAAQFTEGQPSPLQQEYAAERLGWSLFYDVLEALETALAAQDPQAKEFKRRAEEIVADCRIASP